MSYTPPAGDLLPFSLAGEGYVAPGGSAVAFDMRNYPAYIPPVGNLVPLDFKDAAYTPPAGNLVPLEFVEGGAETGDAQYLFPNTFDPLVFGSHKVRNQREHLRPSGWTHYAVGAPSIKVMRAYIAPTGIARPSMASQSIMLKRRNLAPAGYSPMVFGQPTLINRNRYIFAGNLSAPVFSQNHQIFLYTRYLRPTGFVASGYGLLSITHGRRYLQMLSGITPPPIGTLWASASPRLLVPASVLPGNVGFPRVGGSRQIFPQGWNSAAFGTRVTPISQTVAPQGFRELWGDTLVRNKWQFIKPVGFETNVQEQYRWGRAYLWNRRQYIIQTYDVDSELNPPPWSRFQSIANRNKVIGVSGIAPRPMGFPQIDNNARLIEPGGMTPPDYPGTTKRTMIAYAVRRLPVEGIEPVVFSRWHALFNTARVIRPAPLLSAAFGAHALENTRRYFKAIGAIDSARYGNPFVAFRIRGISMEPRYAIQPPVIQLPEVKLHQRHITPPGFDSSRIGLTFLQIHFTIIAPRWVLRDAMGEPFVRNRTPQLKVFGRNSEEYGDAFVRLEWRPVVPDGSNMQLFGKPIIADRKQRITVPGNNMLRIGDKLVVTKTGSPPYWPQNITLEDNVGGIEWFRMMGTPTLNQLVLYPSGINSMRFGSTLVENMGIRIDAGIPTDSYGEPTVQLKNRKITVAPWLDSQYFQPSAPRLSPHTIYAVKEAPPQAIENHPPQSLHYVGETRDYAAGERFGYPAVRLTYDTIRNVAAGEFSRFGIPALTLRKQYVLPPSIRAYRFGWHTASDGRLFIEQFGGTDFQLFGEAKIAQAPYLGPQTIKPTGMAPPAISVTHWASLKHRTFQFAGFEALAMGSSRQDAPYQWQTLHVGPLLPTMPSGFSSQAFGTTWISLRIRNLEVAGFDSFISEYDYQHFAARMRVRNATTPTKPAQGITAVGVDAHAFGVPNVKPGTQYIRPDGNADQQRKGGPNV